MVIISPDLRGIADDLQVEIVGHIDGLPGWYDHAKNLISIREGMGVAMTRSVLAHELAHRYHRDVPSSIGYFTTRQENRANRTAASMLIDPDEFRDAMLRHDDHIGAVADELDVTQHLLGCFIADLERKIAS